MGTVRLEVDGERASPHRELGKHCASTHRRALMQVRGYGG
jgi:hypothetical protein